MGERKNQLDREDVLYDVVSKLSAVTDFIRFIGDPHFTPRRHTPDGLCLIIGECVSALKTIGGLHDSPNS